MKNSWKIAIVALLAAGVVATVALRERKRAGGALAVPAAAGAAARPAAGVAEVPASSSPAPVPSSAPAPAIAPPGAATGRPRLVELGSVRCQACQQMMKVLDALRASQGERLQVDFVDVFEDPAAGDLFGLKMIPTQILYDAAGKEIYRHIGFFSHDEILAKFRAAGVKL